MNIDQNFIDEIVQGVLNQLQPSTAPTAPASSKSNDVLGLTGSVLTADILEQAVKPGTSRIQIGPKTVITPSGLDYLKQNNIQWSRSGRDNNKNSTGSCWKILAVQSTSTADTLWNDIQTSNDNSSAAQETISMICRGETAGIIVLTEQPELVSCLTNRNEQVRAASVSHTSVSQGTVSRLQVSLKPNVYCLDVSSFSYMELRNFWRQINGK